MGGGRITNLQLQKGGSNIVQSEAKEAASQGWLIEEKRGGGKKGGEKAWIKIGFLSTEKTSRRETRGEQGERELQNSTTTGKMINLGQNR